MRSDDYASKPRKKLKLTAPSPKEWHEMRALFEWVKWQLPHHPELWGLNASMNGLRVSDPRIIVQAKLVGFRTGYPDVFLPVARGPYHGCFIEMKRTVGGNLADEQRAWLEWLATQGYYAVTCNGAVSAEKCLLAYLALDKEGV